MPLSGIMSYEGIPVGRFNLQQDNSVIPEETQFREEGQKTVAKILLSDRRHVLIIPSRDEWIGINLLERDDQL